MLFMIVDCISDITSSNSKRSNVLYDFYLTKLKQYGDSTDAELKSKQDLFLLILDFLKADRYKDIPQLFKDNLFIENT